ncbi:MAG: transketolase [Deltaproteobacteria bacterium CG_4_10_14_0_8_um_filter_43_12]|nr:MAG: transketolase [Deltaproteobacteria bacterium CG_4_10_14_0_8_um_filter_43_12]
MNNEQNTLDQLCINTIRTLAMDAVQEANSGHPGTPMALAPLAYVLWTKFLRYNPINPRWFDRDRFVLSCGHASMLQYAVLYLTGYTLSLQEIKNFRQWGSKTPGHPEYGITPGVETTTGPLGQGLMNAAGMAMAEANLAAIFNREGHEIIGHYTYAFCGDGDLMEGASHEAASLAGHLGLAKLIWIYDDNHISIEGDTALTYSDDVAKRFDAYHWHVQNLGDKANDLTALATALTRAKEEKERPSLIMVRSHIGYGSPNRQNTREAHGEPLGEEEIRLTKRFYGWPENEKFVVPEQVLTCMRQAIERGKKLEENWNKKYSEYKKAFPDMAKRFEAALSGDIPPGWDSNIPHFGSADGPIATRAASGKVLKAFADKIPWLMGGSADLSPSTKTLIDESQYFARGRYTVRNIAWGVREHNMCAACSGMALHGGVRPYAATFFIFTDYARPAIRLAAMMGLPVIYVMTHDSIAVGEDGPTHQPVEQLASLRAIPNICIIRPADANEVAYAWRAAITRRHGPTMLVLSRQSLPVFDRSKMTSAEELLKGAYVLSREKGTVPDMILIATGSEVQLIVDAQEKLASDKIDSRVVSMPSWELFMEQPQSYRDEVLPPEVKARLAVEAGSPQGWRDWVGDGGDVIGITKFGASAPYKENFKHYGFTLENVEARAKMLIGK